MIRQVPALLLLLLVLAAAAAVRAQDLDTLLDFEWERVNVSGTASPGLRKDAAVGYDRQRNRLIVFGGKPFNRETWQFNLTSSEWTQLSDGADSPPERFSVVAGMDPGRDRFLVTTGEGPGKVFFNDVWAFDLSADTWSEVTTSGTPPEKRYGAAGGTFLFGADYLFVSHGFSGQRYDNTFALRLADDTWMSLTPGSCPFKRCLAGSVVNRFNRLTMFGGCGSGGYGPCPAQDVWTLSTQALNASAAPSRAAAVWNEHDQCEGPRMFTAMAPAPGQTPGRADFERLMVFGGDGNIYGSGSAGDVGVLHLDDGSWTLLEPAGTERPSVRKQMNVVYVNANASQTTSDDYVLVVGGSTGGDEIWRLGLRGASPAAPEERDCPYVFDLRLFHGLMMFFSWGLLLPIGVFAARFGRHFPNALWFRIHRPVQMLGVVLQTGGVIAAILMVPVGKFSAQPHAGIGVLVFLLGVLQPVNAFFRPHAEPGQPPSRKRIWWERLHKWSGRVALLLGMANPFWGLRHISARPVFRTLYAVWFAVYWAVYVGLSLVGEPGRSPTAQWLNRTLLGGRGRLNLSDRAEKPIPMEPREDGAASSAGSGGAAAASAESTASNKDPGF